MASEDSDIGWLTILEWMLRLNGGVLFGNIGIYVVEFEADQQHPAGQGGNQEDKDYLAIPPGQQRFH